MRPVCVQGGEWDPAMSLLLCRFELWQLAGPLRDLYHLGFIDGRASLKGALAEARSAADRYYRRAFDSRSTRYSVPEVSFADLCRSRGEYDRAATAERGLAKRLAGPSDVG